MGVFCCHGNQTKRQIGRLLAIFNFPYHFLQTFQSIGLSVQEMKRKIDFQDSSFESIGLSVKRQKIDFQDGHYGGHLGLPIEKI